MDRTCGRVVTVNWLKVDTLLRSQSKYDSIALISMVIYQVQPFDFYSQDKLFFSINKISEQLNLNS